MKLKSVSIQNFRKLKNIAFTCNDTINTIVGPNGVGKSSILESLRLVKAMLLPSLDNETQQTLQSMGLLSPHLNAYLFENLFGDKTKGLTIDLKIELEDREMQYIKSQIHNLAILMLQNRLGQNQQNRLNLISLLSTPQGQRQLQELLNEATAGIKEFEGTRIATIKLNINRGNISGENGFHQELVSFVLRNNNYSESLFTIFPADRNFPTGEVAIQLGQQDINLQIQSYSIQPHLKFQRLKSAIISFLLLNNNDLTPIKDDFKLIFESLMPGKELQGIKLESTTGRLSVLIKEPETNAIYDIDFLSSGEKGLLLTLFLLKRTVAKGGIVLIDEPELHLNPAVLNNIVPFLKKYIAEEKDVQIFLTTHSAEILASTKDDESLNLLHLINEESITPIYKKDDSEAQEALRCLGIKTSDLLFNKGVIYLEGTTDEDYIAEILKGVTTGYKIQSLGGRNIIENEIKTLQEYDKKDSLEGFHVFILDFDNKPTSLENTSNVKVIQWNRYSFENYLLNNDVLYDTIKDLNPSNFPSNRGDFAKKVKELAFMQIEKNAVLEYYGNYLPKTISLSKKEIEQSTVEEISDLISSKLEDQKAFFSQFSKEEFKGYFVSEINKRIDDMRQDWNENWNKKCRGKELLITIYNEFKLTNFKMFVKTLVRTIKAANTEEWNVIKAKMEPIFKKA